MTDSPNPEKPENADRIAKVIARAGLASRRDAERLILEGRVTVNGQKIDSPALDVLPSDRITVDGKKLDEPQDTRLWLYYKPTGLVTSESDEKGRQTVFDALPRDLPRVMSIGRLDLNSEGLLLLTNDGELKRRLELPATGWLRRYRVRVNGQPNDLTFAPLRRGAIIDGEEFAPMEIALDSQQGANAWLTIGLREGKNREIRRAMTHVGLIVNRLIRIGYGPFKLGDLEKNEAREVKRRVLRDQLGGLLTGEAEDKPRDFRERGAPGEGGDDRRPRRADGDAHGPRKDRGDRPDRKFSRGPRPEGDRPHSDRRADGDARPPRKDWGDRPDRKFARGPRPDGERDARGPRKDWGDRPDRAARGPRPDGEGRPARKDWGDRPDRKPARGPRPDGDAPRGDRKFSRGPRSDGDSRPPRKDWGDRPDRKPARGPRPEGDAPRASRKAWGDKAEGGFKRGPRPEGDRDSRAPRKSWGDKPQGGFKRGPRADGEGPRKDWGDRPDRKPGRGPRPDGDAPRKPRSGGPARRDFGGKPGPKAGPRGKPGPARGPRGGGPGKGGGAPRG